MLRTSGIFPSIPGIMLLALTACGVRYGFTEGAFPPHVRTIAVLPFENETSSPELQNELFEAMRSGMQERLGVRDAPPERADAIVRGAIRSYDADVPVAFSADPRQTVSARRRLQVTVDVEIIDQTTGHALWSRKGLRAEGEYAERAEPEGRRLAIERIVNDVIEGAQSQW